ncbi:hypothetical protein K435DRAFT_865242 [Dendrothele bispora CBS 962.96]|uniref:Uncharacterized protein n=1 Tax=Dendrothele bispora (strain CBS 962.96) TaxID=1314807 RepID=A0A4S8LLA3_DENBC|nr:hypothetical protein K435DRAFT_865242 [Dendrothele bispora CBS 962.96]
MSSGSNAGNLFSDTNDSVPNSASRDQFLSESKWEKGSWLSNSKLKKSILKLMVMEIMLMKTLLMLMRLEETMGMQTEYLAIILTKLKDEIKSKNRSDCYAAGTFWIYPRDPIFALDAAFKAEGFCSPVELYHLPVFVWLPTFLPGTPESFYCSQCKENLNVTRTLSKHGWSSNPTARRVRNLDGDYYLLTNRFICDGKTGGCKKTYSGYDETILTQLP